MTDLYRAKVKDWEQKTESGARSQKARAVQFGGDLFEDLLEPFEIFGDKETDHLTVKLALGRAPNHSNGQWRDGWVVWETDLNANRALPVLCFASGAVPRLGFKKRISGRLFLMAMI